MCIKGESVSNIDCIRDACFVVIALTFFLYFTEFRCIPYTLLYTTEQKYSPLLYWGISIALKLSAPVSLVAQTGITQFLFNLLRVLDFKQKLLSMNFIWDVVYENMLGANRQTAWLSVFVVIF